MRLVKFAEILKIADAHALFGATDLYGTPLEATYFDAVKDEPNLGKILRLTPREAYIMVSEEWLKPLAGQSVFGDMLLREMAARLHHLRHHRQRLRAGGACRSSSTSARRTADAPTLSRRPRLQPRLARLWTLGVWNDGLGNDTSLEALNQRSRCVSPNSSRRRTLRMMAPIPPPRPGGWR